MMRFLEIVDKSFLFQLQTEGKENGVETDERKDDSIVYADLDKSAMAGMLIKNSFLQPTAEHSSLLLQNISADDPPLLN